MYRSCTHCCGHSFSSDQDAVCIASYGYFVLPGRGRLPYLWRRAALINLKAAAPLVLLALLWNLFKERNLFIVAIRKTESGCKGNNFPAYLPNFPETFFFKAFRPSGQPTGSSPKAGAKVVGSHITAKYIRKFFHQNNEVFHQNNEVFYSNTEIQGVTKSHFPEEEGRGLGLYTII